MNVSAILSNDRQRQTAERSIEFNPVFRLSKTEIADLWDLFLDPESCRKLKTVINATSTASEIGLILKHTPFVSNN